MNNRLNFYKKELRKVNKEIRDGKHYPSSLDYKKFLKSKIKELEVC